MTMWPRTARALLAFAAFLTLMPAAVLAQTLTDPTRPPAALLTAPAVGAASGSGGAACSRCRASFCIARRALRTATQALPAEPALRLQSVLIGSHRQPAALINGQVVLLGARLGDAQLVGVTERSAVLKGPNGLTTLTLLPDVAKHDLAADRVAPRVRSNRQPTRIAEQRP